MTDYQEAELAAGRPRRRIGRYTVLKRLASGGMASVFLAQISDQRFEKLVAIKRPLTHLLDNPAIIQMFDNEVGVLSRLDHENICPIIDFGTDDEGPYLVMPYLHGEPLSELMIHYATRREQSPPDLMAYFAADVCDGLHFAHNAKAEGRSLGLVHRDITPHNIFITFDGSVKILDFGVAKAIGGQEGLSVAGVPKGKFAYMSPEQARGDALDQRSDLFSLGVVLWEALTGRRLFRRDTAAATLMAIEECQVPRMSELGVTVPDELAAIVDRALTPRRQERFPSAREMGQKLRLYLARREAVLCPTEVAAVMEDLFPREAFDRDPLSSVTEPRASVGPEPGAIASRAALRPVSESNDEQRPTMRVDRASLGVRAGPDPQIVELPDTSGPITGPEAVPPSLPPRPSGPPPLPPRSIVPTGPPPLRPSGPAGPPADEVSEPQITADFVRPIAIPHEDKTTRIDHPSQVDVPVMIRVAVPAARSALLSTAGSSSADDRSAPDDDDTAARAPRPGPSQPSRPAKPGAGAQLLMWIGFAAAGVLLFGAMYFALLLISNNR